MRKSLLGAGNALYLVLGAVTQTSTGVTVPWDTDEQCDLLGD